MRGVALSVAAAVTLAACNPASEAKGDAPVFDAPGPQAEEIYSGVLTQIDGEWVGGSQLRITLYSLAGDQDVADRYYISSGCFDAGFLDAEDGRFWSGHAPAKNGETVGNLTNLEVERRCPRQDHERYGRLMEIMYEGATLELDEQQGNATFTAPTKGSARFGVEFNVGIH